MNFKYIYDVGSAMNILFEPPTKSYPYLDLLYDLNKSGLVKVSF